jgi:L-asparaginase
VPVRDLVARLPNVAAYADVSDADDLIAARSTAFGYAEWLALVAKVRQLHRDDPDLAGVVVTHGTGTLEETAYFLALALDVPVAVVVVGSLRPVNYLSSDADLNLLDAVRVAAYPLTQEMGAVVVMNNEIHTARDVTKTSTHRLDAFRSRDTGPLGYVEGDAVTYYRQPIRRHSPDTELAVAEDTTLPRVDIHYSFGGADGAAIDAFVARGARAIVSASMPSGHVTPDEEAALTRARAAGVLTVMSSRAGSGRVFHRESLRRQGTIAADDLTPQKARVLAALALTQTTSPAAVQSFFDRY